MLAAEEISYCFVYDYLIAVEDKWDRAAV